MNQQTVKHEPTPAWNPVGQFVELASGQLAFVTRDIWGANYECHTQAGATYYPTHKVVRPTDKVQIVRKPNRVSIMVGDKEVARRYNTGKWQSQYEPSLNEQDMLLYAFAIQMVCKHVPLKAE